MRHSVYAIHIRQNGKHIIMVTEKDLSKELNGDLKSSLLCDTMDTQTYDKYLVTN